MSPSAGGSPRRGWPQNIENAVGVQLAAKNRSEYAFAVVINSPLQIALVLAPLLVILSTVFGFASLTLVFAPLLVVSVAVAVLLSAFITFDGKSTWIEGAGAHRPLRSHRGDVLVGLSVRTSTCTASPLAAPAMKRGFEKLADDPTR